MSIFDKLARDSKDKTKLDGVSHIKPHMKVHLGANLVALIAIFSYVEVYSLNFYYFIECINTVNYSVLGIMFFVWVYIEWDQERAMVKDGRHAPNNHWKPWKWSLNRYQDIIIPESAGVAYTFAVNIIIIGFIRYA